MKLAFNFQKFGKFIQEARQLMDLNNSLSEALVIAKAIKSTVYVTIADKTTMSVQQDSNVVDLFKIYDLEMELIKLKAKK